MQTICFFCLKNNPMQRFCEAEQKVRSTLCRVLEREAAGGRFSVIEQRKTSGCSASSNTQGESMDNLYQAIKGLCKAVINLVVALLDLLAGIFNGIACLFEKIRPRASRQFHEIRENEGLKFSSFRKTSGEEMEDKKVFGKNTGKGLDEEKIQSIRERLTGKVVSRDTYYQTYTKASYSSREHELIVLIAFLSLLSVILLLGMTGISGGSWLALTVVILLQLWQPVPGFFLSGRKSRIAV